jgi:polyisoprenoid-binding protein YceI
MNRSMRLVSAVAFSAILAMAPAFADSFKIDGAHSSTQFSVTHMMISTVRGSFGSTTGTIEYDGKSVASIKADVTIDAASIDTNNEKRDGHLKSPDFFDVEKFPTLAFKSTKVVPGTNGAFKLVGDLTMHGVTKEVTLDVTGPSPVMKGKRGDQRVGASATTSINRQDYGVKWNNPLEGGGVVVSDTVKITIDLEAVMPPPEAAAPPPPPAKN